MPWTRSGWVCTVCTGSSHQTEDWISRLQDDALFPPLSSPWVEKKNSQHGSRRDGHGRRPVLYECKTVLARSMLNPLANDHQMLFTWSTHNLCIVFRQWHITSTVSLLVSLAAIAFLTAGYEGVRQISRQYELSHATKMSAFSSAASSKSSILHTPRITHAPC